MYQRTPTDGETISDWIALNLEQHDRKYVKFFSFLRGFSSLLLANQQTMLHFTTLWKLGTFFSETRSEDLQVPKARFLSFYWLIQTLNLEMLWIISSKLSGSVSVKKNKDWWVKCCRYIMVNKQVDWISQCCAILSLCQAWNGPDSSLLLYKLWAFFI